MYDILASVHFTQLNKGFCTFVKILVVLCFTSLNCPSSNFFSHTQSPWKRHHVVIPDSKFVLSVQKCCRMEIDNLTSIKRCLHLINHMYFFFTKRVNNNDNSSLYKNHCLYSKSHDSNFTCFHFLNFVYVSLKNCSNIAK